MLELRNFDALSSASGNINLVIASPSGAVICTGPAPFSIAAGGVTSLLVDASALPCLQVHQVGRLRV